MIPKTYIERNIKILSKNFQSSQKPLMTLLYAKLVIIEIGGWVELSMDDIINRAGKKLKEDSNIVHLEKEIIQRNYGFSYERNFRPMLMKAIGLTRLEKLEKSLDLSKHQKMVAALKNLKTARDKVAHTYIKDPALRIVDAPSVSQRHFNDIYAGLKDLEEKMKRINLI
ncbi:endoribonuclease [Pseudomonas aeruginosa]|uniref:endoribonuclease n=1 Tax=Pseudomonas aeruginosa TaxID=287 RepID=UPI000FC429E8|nr:endoribonuclease [Pseudomonas aeruginosa]RUC18135.1 endoribonuclease [Pseudomonas aeruginosa]HCL4119090.1 hypothetical protein [Pseudomonas aeruginosa]HEJ4182706.1 hypothetical protein [Pseudomonas aeruginosa]